MNQIQQAQLESKNIDFQYIIAQPTKWTFEPKPVRKYVEENLQGRVLNSFAGKTKLRHDGEIVRNDIDTERDADYHMDALELVREIDGTFDTVIFDPPYNLRKSREKYNGRMVGSFTKVKEETASLVNPAGRTIHFGYTSEGMGRQYGFAKDEIALINHKGDHNDTIVTIERKQNETLEGL